MIHKNYRAAWLRASVIIAAVIATVAGVTFAALQSQTATLSGNTISSATANLQIGTSPGDLGDRLTGFTFTNVEPGAGPLADNDHSFYLANSGTTALDLKTAIAPGMTWPPNVDIGKVWLQITAPDGSVSKQSLASLYDSYTQGYTALDWQLTSGNGGTYKLQALIDAGAITGGNDSAVTIGGLDLVFQGTAAG